MPPLMHGLAVQLSELRVPWLRVVRLERIKIERSTCHSCKSRQLCLRQVRLQLHPPDCCEQGSLVRLQAVEQPCRERRAGEILGGAFAASRPGGAFYLWLDVGDGEAAARRLWAEAGIRVLPGAYLAQTDAGGGNPGKNYIRVALVHDIETTRDAVNRIRETLGP